MFNKKRISELEVQLQEEKKRNDILLAKLNDISKEMGYHTKNIIDCVKPKEVVHYDKSAIDLVNQISTMRKKRDCGFGGCGFFYMVDINFIENILKSKSSENNQESE